MHPFLRIRSDTFPDISLQLSHLDRKNFVVGIYPDDLRWREYILINTSAVMAYTPNKTSPQSLLKKIKTRPQISKCKGRLTRKSKTLAMVSSG